MSQIKMINAILYYTENLRLRNRNSCPSPQKAQTGMFVAD